MAILVALITLLLAALVVFVVSAPLRSSRRASATAPAAGADDVAGQAAKATERADLHAAREAKYREIRDAELDYRTGKLSRADFEAVDADLRAEALEILDRIDDSQTGPAD